MLVKSGIGGLCSVLLIILLTVSSILADAPEDKVWEEMPDSRRADKIGRFNEDVDLAVYGSVYYVSSEAKFGNKSDGSKERPWRNLSDALGKINGASPSNRAAILVSEGIYSGGTVKMKPNVDMFGGYNSGNWKREICKNSTFLDGKGKRRVVLGNNNCRIDGFVITGGRSNWHGAGMLCNRTSPTISNNVFIGNCPWAPEGFVHKPERRRHVGNDGGAIACVDGANPIITNNIIFNNTTDIGNGAGIACRDDSCPRIEYNVIWGNRTGLKDEHDTRSSNGGAISCFAGVIALISNNVIANNDAAGNSDGGGIYCEYNSSPDIYYNYVLGNKGADDGGGMEIMKCSQPRIYYNFVAGNSAGGGGSGIRMSDQGLARIHNNTVVYNIAGGSTGAVGCTNGWMILEDNIIANNRSDDAGGIIYYNENWPQLKVPVIRNNVVRGNRKVQVDIDNKKTVFEGNNIEGGYSQGKGNYDKDPGFVDDGVIGKVLSVKFDADSFLSTIEAEPGNFKGLTLGGRVVKIGGKWSVIISNDQNHIKFWGPVDKEAGSFEIVQSFTKSGT